MPEGPPSEKMVWTSLVTYLTPEFNGLTHFMGKIAKEGPGPFKKKRFVISIKCYGVAKCAAAADK